MKPFSVRPCIRKDKLLKDGKYPIYLWVRVMGEAIRVPSGYEIEESLWDNKAKLPKKNPLRTVIGNIKSDLETFLLTEQGMGGELSLNLVRDYFGGKKKIKPENGSFYDYYLEFVEDKKKAGKDDDTIRIYNNTYVMLKEFAPKLKICDINLKFIEKFDAFLRDVKGNQDGGRENKHKNIRAVILDMIRHDINIKNPYANDKFKMPKAKIRETYLELNELVAMRELLPQFEAFSPRRMSMQMFLLACYTGLRISDILDLKWSHIDWENQRINKKQVKTKDSVTIVIEPWAKAILLEFSNSKKNIGTDNPVFENAVTSNTVNLHLKEFAKMAGIKKTISCHVARHTFVTLQILAGTDVLTIKALAGHSKITSTMVYFNDSKKLVDDHAKKSQLFKSKND
ncbi:tyrosine-type recombinase/integrase [Dysgonomonas mossii]|uniref:tyrosine-type recombinase/integrase n=1 Tax=Dysgonomonas mossii TaxID=163665 RepID=UPI0039956AEF